MQTDFPCLLLFSIFASTSSSALQDFTVDQYLLHQNAQPDRSLIKNDSSHLQFAFTTLPTVTMINTREAAQRLQVAHAQHLENITAINTIPSLTSDPNLRLLLTENEYERATIEERISALADGDDFYQQTVARMDLARNRATYDELADLAATERSGLTDDPRRDDVDGACGRGWRRRVRPEDGPKNAPTDTTLYQELNWEEKENCCEDASCEACRPVSPKTRTRKKSFICLCNVA